MKDELKQVTAKFYDEKPPSELAQRVDISFYKRVNGIELTKKERLVAQHLLDNHSKAGFMTASGISRELNISDGTVIRFARKLGYAGFANLQKALQSEMVEKLTHPRAHAIMPQNRLDQTLEQSDGKNLLSLVVEGLAENVRLLAEKNSDEIFERVARIIFKSRRTVVMGFRGCAAVATSLTARLSYLLDNVYPVTHMDPSDYSPVFNLKKGDCLIVIGFEEYQKGMVSMVKQAQKHRVSVIAITDRETSPLAFRSAACVYCSIKGISFNSFSTVTLATDIISAHLVKMIGHDAQIRNKELLDYMRQSGYYWDCRET